MPEETKTSIGPDATDVEAANPPRNVVADAGLYQMVNDVMEHFREDSIHRVLTKLIYDYNEPVRINRLCAAAIISVLVNAVLFGLSGHYDLAGFFVTTISYAVICVICGKIGGYYLCVVSCWLPIFMLIARGLFIALIVIFAYRHNYYFIGMCANMLVLTEYCMSLREMCCARDPLSTANG